MSSSKSSLSPTLPRPRRWPWRARVPNGGGGSIAGGVEVHDVAHGVDDEGPSGELAVELRLDDEDAAPPA